jgi:hypothetical protein
MKNFLKELVCYVLIGILLLSGAIIIAGPTAGKHSIAYKVSMRILKAG